MTRTLRALAAGVLLIPLFVGPGAFAQKSGGVLKVYFFDSPASMSIHEEATIAAQGPMMGVFNNLVMYKQDVPQNSLQSIDPDLASDWSWDEDKTQLTFGCSPGSPCHVPPREMRAHPIGTGPFKFVEFKPNESIKVTKNPDYWKKGRPYLDGIEYTIIKNVSTGVMAFAAGKFDMTSPYYLQVPVLKYVKDQAPE